MKVNHAVTCVFGALAMFAGVQSAYAERPAVEVGAEVGGFVNGFRDAAGGGISDPYLMYVLDAKLRPLAGSEGFAGALMIDAALAGHTPLDREGAQGLLGLARLGVDYDAFTLALGVYVRNDFIEAQPNQRGEFDLATLALLPSLTLEWRPAGDFGVHLGLFDRLDGGSVARAGVSYGGVGVSYLALTGAEVFADIPLSDSLALTARAYGTFLIAGAFSAGASAGATMRW